MSLARVESDAQDLTQQTYYVLATKGHQLRDASKLKSWLFATLHHAFLQTRRKQSRFIHQDLDDVAEQLPAAAPTQFDQVDSSQVLSALAKVDDVYRAAVALFYLGDYSYRDIAAILEVPVGTVKSRIARGILQLRVDLLAGEFVGPLSGKNATSLIGNEDESAQPSESILSLNSAPYHGT
jgi:RNA polymerase sigma-70 factor (ECF subfamily)